MYLPTPSYTFITCGGQRQFVHRWQLNNNEIIECNKCGSTCNQTDAYSKHWLQKTHNSFGSNKKLTNELSATKNGWSAGQKTTLASVGRQLQHNSGTRTNELIEQLRQAIDNKNVKSFMLCDNRPCNKGSGSTGATAQATNLQQQFLLDSGIKILPDLFRALFDFSTKELQVKIRFYLQMEQDANEANSDVVAHVTTEIFMLQTSELSIANHHDIRESVDMIFAMSLEKLQKENLKQNYQIKRMKIQVKRQQDEISSMPPQLPLQYKLKPRTIVGSGITKQTHNSKEHVKLLQQLRHHFKENNTTIAELPKLTCNLYCFQVCANSQELYVVPYYISDSNSSPLPNYIIMQDVMGKFHSLLEISNLKRFLRYSPADEVLDCRRCQAKFMQHTQLALHEMLLCGLFFRLSSMPEDYFEIYEKCLLLSQCAEWSLYGIVDALS